MNMPAKVKDEHAKSVCRIGQGAGCCSFLMVGSQGFECAKNTELQLLLEERRQNKTMVAMANNCDGPPNFKELT